MNREEIVAFHQEYKHINTIEHLILEYCNVDAHTYDEIYEKMYRSYKVVSKWYIKVRIDHLLKLHYLEKLYLIGDDNQMYCISPRAQRLLLWLDQYADTMRTKFIEKKEVGNVT